jgi:hypothetical protein
MGLRKTYSAEAKAQVVLAILKEEKSACPAYRANADS